MKKLGIAYVGMMIITGLVILGNLLWSLPDGKLHLTFCNVGQGDAVYIRFPDGKDMLVDGGPDARVLACLGRHMPFWDRSLDLMVLTHPQKDHMAGLVSVLDRFRVSYVLRSDADNDKTDLFRSFRTAISRSGAETRLVTAGQTVRVSGALLTVLWPSQAQIALLHPFGNAGVLGATSGDLNDASVVLHLSFGGFDALLAGDADSHVNGKFAGRNTGNRIEILKVPHHGSRTAMTEKFLKWVDPELAVISVGKNAYGHPARETLDLLKKLDIPVRRTDTDGDVTVISDGKTWQRAR